LPSDQSHRRICALDDIATQSDIESINDIKATPALLSLHALWRAMLLCCRNDELHIARSKHRRADNDVNRLVLVTNNNRKSATSLPAKCEAPAKHELFR
jgi:hypothetical protein